MDSSLLKRHLGARLEMCETTSRRKKESTVELMRVGMDLAKNVFQLHGVDRQEKPVLRKRLGRGEMYGWIVGNIGRECEIGMEACGAAHHWARKLMAQGYRVKLIAPQFVKPYVKGNKNDARDAEAICEAMSRPGMHFVAVKSVEQQDVQAIHRVRSELIEQRTAKVNQIRGLSGEYGLVAPIRIEALRRAIPIWLEDAENGLHARFRWLLQGLWKDLQGLDERIKEMDKEIGLLGKEPAAQRLQTIPGIGPISATALVSAVGDASQFRSGRHMAAWLGLTPKQHSSGEKDRLLGISKRGDAYLRTLLIHGARAAVSAAKEKSDPRSQWLRKLANRRHQNVVVVALANKNARIAWALLRRSEDYDDAHTSALPSGKPLAITEA
jgi:transposase